MEELGGQHGHGGRDNQNVKRLFSSLVFGAHQPSPHGVKSTVPVLLQYIIR